MTVRKQNALTWALGIFLGAAAMLATVRLAHAQPDPIAAADHAGRVRGEPVPLVNPPPTVFQPTAWSRLVSTARRVGENTGGAPLVLILGAVVDRARARYPRLKRGDVGRVTLGLWAALLWAGACLGTGATWATAVSGVLLAVLTGAVWAAVPTRSES